VVGVGGVKSQGGINTPPEPHTVDEDFGVRCVEAEPVQCRGRRREGLLCANVGGALRERRPAPVIGRQFIGHVEKFAPVEGQRRDETRQNRYDSACVVEHEQGTRRQPIDELVHPEHGAVPVDPLDQQVRCDDLTHRRPTHLEPTF
jgi:hypothetical protein